MAADLGKVDWAVWESGFDDPDEPTSFSMGIDNNNAELSDGTNTVSVYYEVKEGGNTLGGAYITAGGGEVATETISWSDSDVSDYSNIEAVLTDVTVFTDDGYELPTDTNLDKLEIPDSLSPGKVVYSVLVDVSCPSVDAPNTVTPGDTVTLTSTISNGNDSPVSTSVEFGFGDEAQQQTVSVPANGSETATVGFTPSVVGDYQYGSTIVSVSQA